MTTYIGITDFNNQRFIVEANNEDGPYDPHDVARPNGYEESALRHLRDKIVNSEPIECEIVHDNNRAKMTVIFIGPVRLDIATNEETTT